ncbi:MAG: metallophosphoesterase [Methanomicrobiaceae archaeon]|uniref:Calcineurin-like phosphoesterase domain-containing protein n=1 Tax=hydrocarbon metagenome TaxID=938273 RepID=A0A0W8FGN5_9ZZZZ|nr:metallophosphoesterase [Methanomicrobiaceae archaeon]MDD5418486.1 metallophosphoesterase [Methanomicrobiaceae archaeon]
MAKKSLVIPDDRSVIVVSDLHLGSQEGLETARRFYRFLEHLSNGCIPLPDACRAGGAAASPDPATRECLLPPEAIILLGDILELWDPRNQDRNMAYTDAFQPFLTMRDMDCDVIYVAGNHDEDIVEIIESYDEELGQLEQSENGLLQNYRIEYLKEEGRQKPVSLKIPWRGSRKLEICSRKYPAPRLKGGELGIDVGGTRYAFLHGQQFDREQITYTTSQVLGRRFDPVDFFQDLACTSVARMFRLTRPGKNPLLTIGIFLAAILLAAIPLWAVLASDSGIWRPVIGALGGILLALISLYYGLFRFGDKERDYPSSAVLGLICALIFILVVGALWAGMMNYLFYIPLILSGYFLAVIGIPVAISVVKKRFYNRLSSTRDWTSEKIMNPQKSSFDPSKYLYESPVLVFGHTHIPDFERGNLETGRIRLFVNSGSWMREDGKSNADLDTFIYIDKAGICCLRWNDEEGRVECYRKDKGGPEGKVPLCEYILKSNIQLRD